MKRIFAGKTEIGGDELCIIAGPCVIENRKVVFETAEKLKEISAETGTPFVFKASFDKANRSSVKSFRGPGMEEGLEILSDIRKELSIPVLTDVHCVSQIETVAKAVDIIQIPAFLCRQTDILLKAGSTGLPVNIKKGQFLSPWDVSNIIEKVASTGNDRIIITERGTSFGYNNLVTDFRALPIMRGFGYPVFYDATHSVQEPGKLGGSSGGKSEYVPFLAQAAVAVGCDGIFMEVHPDPEKALSDGPNMLKLSEFKDIIKKLKLIHHASRQ